MIKSLKKIALALATLSLVLAPVALPSMAYAQAEPDPAATGGASIKSNVCQGIDLNVQTSDTAPANCGDATAGQTSLQTLAKNVVDLFSLVVGVVSVIMIIVGGFKYITSGGESGNVTGAKNTILFALIGLIIVVLAQVIVRFVIGKAGAV